MLEINPLVSVIVPVFNAETTIRKCIESILAQDHENIELLLVNDGSTDESGAICEAYQRNDKRVRLIEQANAGVSVARNRGIEMAKGEWLAFVDADDWIEPNGIGLLRDAAVTNRLDICIGSYYADNGRGRSGPISFFAAGKKEIVFPRDRDDVLISCLCLSGISNDRAPTNVGVPWAKLYRRALLTDNDIRFPAGMKRMQDSIFNLYAFQAAKAVGCVSHPVYTYRQWSGSACNRYMSDFHSTAKQILERIYAFAMEYQKQESFMQAYHAKAIALVIEGAKLQLLPKQNGADTKHKIRLLRDWVAEDPCRDAVQQVDDRYLSPNQRLARALMRSDRIGMLYFLLALKYKLH